MGKIHRYQKDPSNHSKLIVDELAAENVQSIFRWKISGMSNQGIADRLNAGKVPSPAARKLQSGATKDFFYGLSCSLKVLFVEKLQEGRVTIEEAAEDAGMTVEKFKKVMENTSLQAV